MARHRLNFVRGPTLASSSIEYIPCLCLCPCLWFEARDEDDMAERAVPIPDRAVRLVEPPWADERAVEPPRAVPLPDRAVPKADERAVEPP